MNTYNLNQFTSLKRGALTLCIGKQTGENIIRSVQAAEYLAKKTNSGPVLYINTIQTSRQLGASIRSAANPKYSSEASDPAITYYTSAPGLLSGYKGQIEQMIESANIKTLIINSLDFASKDYRHKEDLIFTIMEWMGRYGISVIVFSQLRKNLPEAGNIQYGAGVGKIAGLAQDVVSFVHPSNELGSPEITMPAATEQTQRSAKNYQWTDYEFIPPVSLMNQNFPKRHYRSASIIPCQIKTAPCLPSMKKITASRNCPAKVTERCLTAFWD
jgi:hypothetical protein